MWKALPMQGALLSEVRLEGSGKGRDVIVVPKTGERLRFPASGDVTIETVGRIIVRTSAIDEVATRLRFLGDLILERGELAWDGGEAEWEALWRRARTRSRPWWQKDDAQEIELDQALHARLVIASVVPQAPKT